MVRWLFNAFAGFCLLLAVLIALAWARSDKAWYWVSFFGRNGGWEVHSSAEGFTWNRFEWRRRSGAAGMQVYADEPNRISSKAEFLAGFTPPRLGLSRADAVVLEEHDDVEGGFERWGPFYRVHFLPP